MKKYLIFVMVISLFLGGLPNLVVGETVYDKKMEEVILKVKGLFNISDDYDSFNSQVSSSDSETYFYFNWSDSQEKLDNLSVSTNEEGDIISFNKYNPVYVQTDTKLPKYSYEEAEKLALDFIQKIDPVIYKEIKIEDNKSPINSWDIDYNFRYIRVVNSVPFPANTVNINVNKFTGEISNYHTNWQRDIVFSEIEKVISLEEGIKAYKEGIGLDLMYKNSYRLLKMLDTNEETKNYLAYSKLENNKAIDAFSGEVINLGYFGPMYSTEAEKTMVSGSSNESSITPEERAAIDKLSGILDVNKIEKSARETLQLDDDFSLLNKNLYTSRKNPGEFQWSLYFIKKIDENRNTTVDITLDAKTSDLINFYRYNESRTDSKAVITKDQAFVLANEYINKIHPGKFNQVELIVDEALKENQLSYYFRFIRKIDDIYVESDSISVGVDAVDKMVLSYNLDWFNGDFPPKGNVIDINKAYEVLFNKVGYELRYVMNYDQEKPEGENNEIKLVYSVSSNKPNIIDAYSGEILDNSGSAYNDNKVIEYIDIENSYSKDKIKTLAEYGVGFNGSEFKPKELIKQKDFIYLLWRSINTYRNESEVDIEKIYTELTKSNIVKDGEKSLDRVVTKEEAVKFVIRAMNYGKIAEISNIYIDLFEDSKEITPSLKGHMNIAYGLKIISGDGSGMIKSRNDLKREDAASIIYNYMFN